MIKRNYILNATNGLSSRMSSLLVSQANHFKSDLFLIYDTEKANLKSIMNVMALVIRFNEKFSIIAEGSDEEAAINQLEIQMKDNGII